MTVEPTADLKVVMLAAYLEQSSAVQWADWLVAKTAASTVCSKAEKWEGTTVDQKVGWRV